jgi:hypothetical protein
MVEKIIAIIVKKNYLVAGSATVFSRLLFNFFSILIAKAGKQ